MDFDKRMHNSMWQHGFNLTFRLNVVVLTPLKIIPIDSEFLRRKDVSIEDMPEVKQKKLILFLFHLVMLMLLLLKILLY